MWRERRITLRVRESRPAGIAETAAKVARNSGKTARDRARCCPKVARSLCVTQNKGVSGDDEQPPNDVLFLHSPTEDGGGIRVIRSTPNKLEVGEVRPLREGQPLTGGEVVALEPRAFDQDGTPRICEVKVLYEGGPRSAPRAAAAAPGGAVERPPTGAARSGPAQVTTNAYRQSWDTIFGRKSALN